MEAAQDRAIITAVTGAIDLLVAAGRKHHGLIPSLLDCRTGTMLTEAPQPIPGQRGGDRAYNGTNLIHDTALLATMLALGRQDYSEAAHACIERFATHCSGTVTGLFPWGEHAYWNLVEDRVGFSDVIAHHSQREDAVHDHLRQVPVWLWEKIHQANPEAVLRFAEGLDWHWSYPERPEYIRHARILKKERYLYKTDEISGDFPRHSGFYMLDLAFAWTRTGRDDFRQQLQRFVDYWWPKRHDSGLLPIMSRAREEDKRYHAAGQTLSLGISLLEAANLVEQRDPALAATMRERADVYIGGFLAAPHDLAAGRYIISCNAERGAPLPDGKGLMPIWGSRYGLWPASYVALACCCGYRLTGKEGLLRWAESVGRAYAATPMPAGIKTPAMDAGLGLGLLADLYQITGEARWLSAARTLAAQLIGIYFAMGTLPTGASGIAWYESQMGPSFLLHGLARTALLAADREKCPLGPDYTAR